MISEAEAELINKEKRSHDKFKQARRVFFFTIILGILTLLNKNNHWRLIDIMLYLLISSSIFAYSFILFKKWKKNKIALVKYINSL